MKVAEYFAEFSIRPDRNSIRLVDSELKKLENKLRGLGRNSTIKLKLSGFNVDRPALRLALSNSLDIASKSVAFEISKFVVNDRNLQAALLRAARRLPPLPPRPNPPLPPRPPVPPYPPRPGPYPPDSRRGSGAASGFIGGGVARLYSPALALAFGGYGLAQLNKRNQQVVSAQLQSSAVVQQAGGTVEQGADSFQYLRKEANRIGFNYLDASQDYNKLISGLTGSGVSVKESQKVFSGFAELARVNKLDKTTQNRLFRALSQVAGKGKLQAEELTGQISEALPGGTALFAQAYQRQLKDTGKGKGDLTGQAAIQALLADMKKGIVNSGILTYAGSTASDKAQTGLALAQTASQAEQQRYQNSVNDLAVVASDAGIEEGFARIFRTLAVGLDESNGLVRILAEGFNDATKFADDLLLWPQSFVRAFEGRDSLVADWLGKDDTAELISDWKQIKALWADINSISSPSWLPTLEATSKELKSLLDAIARLQGTKDQSKGIIQEEYQKDPSTWGNIKGVAKANWFTFSNTVDALNPMDMEQAKKNWGDWLGIDSWKNPETVSPSQFDSPESQRQFALDSAAAAQEDGVRARMSMSLDRSSGGFGLGQLFSTEESTGIYPSYGKGYKPQTYQAPMFDPIVTDNGEKNAWQPQTPVEIADHNKSLAMSQAEASITNNNITNQFDITISVDATLAGIEIEQQAQAMAEAVSTSLTGAFEQVQVNFPQK